MRRRWATSRFLLKPIEVKLYMCRTNKILNFKKESVLPLGCELCEPRNRRFS